MKEFDRNRFFRVLGVIILVAAAMYYAFIAIDSLGLTQQHDAATVVAKDHRAAGHTYTTEIVGNRTLVVPHATPDTFVVRVDLAGHLVEAPVEKSFYDSVGFQDVVRVTYQRRRITGIVQVIVISP